MLGFSGDGQELRGILMPKIRVSVGPLPAPTLHVLLVLLHSRCLVRAWQWQLQCSLPISSVLLSFGGSGRPGPEPAWKPTFLVKANHSCGRGEEFCIRGSLLNVSFGLIAAGGGDLEWWLSMGVVF